MAHRRIFLDWHQPALSQTAAWLERTFAQSPWWDLADVWIVLPGARAGRRLLEKLVMLAQKQSLTLLPPRIITVGQLPGLLVQTDLPLANELVCQLAYADVLDHCSDDQLAQLKSVRAQQPSKSNPPKQADWPALLALAKQLLQLHHLLQRDGCDVKQALERLDKLPDFCEQQRWQVLGQLHHAYLEKLNQLGLADPDMFYLRAARDGGHREGHHNNNGISNGNGNGVNNSNGGGIGNDDVSPVRHLVLAACCDLHGTTRVLLEQHDGPVDVLIHGPEEMADCFDALGGLQVQRWQDQWLDLSHVPQYISSNKQAQAKDVLQAIVQQHQLPEHFNAPDLEAPQHQPMDPGNITLGLGDEADGAFLERTCQLAGLPTQNPIAQTMAQSRPFVLLQAMGRWIDSWRLDDFASLLRHPDMERYLLAKQQDPSALDDWLLLLDRYANDHLQQTLTGDWLGDPDRQRKLKAMDRCVKQLLPEHHDKPRLWRDWSEDVAQLLGSVYGIDQLKQTRENDNLLIQALQVFSTFLRQLGALAPFSALMPRVGLTQGIALMLSCLADQTLAPSGSEGEAVALLGFLELQLDDADHLVIAGFNEGQIPSSLTHDAFLPNHVRSYLQLADNAKRYARDLYMLSAMVHSRPKVSLCMSQTGSQGDPLLPSRLLFACDQAQIPQRVLDFYQPDAASAKQASASKVAKQKWDIPLLKPGENQFCIPEPVLPQEPIAQLRVTGFGDYLACPYRFYLKYICQLKSMQDHVIEMDGASFGTLAHGVLADFGQSGLAHSQDAGQITAYLDQQLDRHVARQLGNAPAMVLQLQAQQLRQRLHLFAHWQAQQTQAGWRILPDCIEVACKAVLEVEGLPFTITGKIDRIDTHETLGIRIIDYKTADTAVSPKNAHLCKGQWINLQLPLYQLLAKDIIDLPEDVQLGYVCLPNADKAIAYAWADWSALALQEAQQVAHQIIGKLRQGIFWPPGQQVPAYDDGLSGVCMDHCRDRAQLIDQTTDRLAAKGAPVEGTLR